MMQRPVLVNLAELPYSRERRRNQRVFEMLVKDGSLFSGGIYVNPVEVTGSTWPSPGQVTRFVWPAAKSQVAGVAIVAPAFILPFCWRMPIARASVMLLAAQLLSMVGARSYCLWVNNPQYHPFLLAQTLRRRASKMLLDLSDDFTAFEDPDPAGLERRVRELTRQADGVIAVNAHVEAKFPHRRSIVFRNGTDFEAMQRQDLQYSLGDFLPKAPGRKYVGFIGGLHRGRVDEGLLDATVTAFPGVTFIFVGYSNDSDLLRRLAERPNVRIHAAVPYDELPYVIRAFDVAIIPHLDNEFTRGNDLLKLRDYLACGIPVVATRSSGMSEYEGIVHVCDGRGEFLAAISRLLAGEVPHDASAGLAVAQRESWPNRIPQLITWLRDVVGIGADDGITRGSLA